MNPNVIENDPKKVKQYMQNFVPVNFYQVLGDSYLSQVRAVLNYSNLEYELSNPVYDKLISDLTSKANSQAKAIAELESKYDKVLSGVNTRIDGISVFETTIGDKVRLYENTIKIQTDSLLSIESNIRASIKNVDVGGRNLIANSDLRFGYPERGDTKVTLADHALGKLISAKSNVKTGNVFGVESGGEYNTINLIEGKEYTISFYAYGSVKTLDEIKLISLSGETIKVPNITINSDLSKRYSYTFTAPSTADNYGYQLLATSTGVNSWFSYSGLKLEIGNVATDWSPNPKDLDDIQEDIYSNIKEFKQVYADENSASAEKLEQLTAKHLANKAEITEHKKVYASQYSAQAQTINEMQVNVGTNTAKIKDIDTVYANKYTAVAERATALEAKTATAQADIIDINKVTASNTQAIVDSSREMKAELGSVEVGGRNLIRNSDLANGEQLLGGATVVKGGSILGKTSTFTATTPDIAFGFKQNTEDAKIPVVKNQRYTFSVYASASKNIKEINYIYLRSEDGFVQKLPNLAVDDMFAMRGSVTFTANFTSSVAAITFACTDAIAGSWFKIAGLKLEKGTKATDYSPAPEDIIGFIDKVEATYNEYVKLNVTKDKATAERFTGLEARTAVAEGSITRIDGIVATQSGTIASHNTRITTAYDNAGLAMGKANEVDTIAKRAEAAAIKANTDISLLVTSTSTEQKAQVKREEEIRTTITQQAGEIAALKGGGRNLLLQTQTGAVEGKYLTKAGVETTSALWKITPYIPIRGELDYFTSAKGAMDYGTVQSLVFYDSAKKFIIGYAGIERKLVTSPVNAAYVRISFLKTDYPSIMFQEGNIPTKWAPAPEDLNKEIQDLQDLINGLDFSVDQAILDGVVDQAEAKQLNVLLLQLNTEKAELAARITTFEGNTDLTPATLDQLRKYWTTYSNQHTAVVDVCNSIIELGTVSDATKLQLKTEFSLYSSALANLVTSFEKATDSVGSTRMIAVASDAEKKIAAAEAAAKVFATTEADLKRIEAEAYADGIITIEEAARIKQATDNLADAKADSLAKSNTAAKAAKDYADAQDVKKLTDAKSYADNKASLAKQGAEAYALAQIELNTVETNAYADGIVTAEEQARIAQATANLNAAKAEAKRLADEAELAAKNFATQKADAALALAKTDAKTKADAAQTAAQGYALAQADAKRVAAEAYADGKITVEELARIKHANDVLVEAKADSLKKANDARDSAQAYADLSLQNLVIGGRNLLITSDASIVKGKYISSKGVATSSALWLISGSIPITAGYDYIISGINNLGTAPATVFYDASGAVISGLVGTKRLSFVAPAGAVSMKVSMLQTDLPLVMIENGTKASSLSVAPEDVAKYAQDAATEAENAAKAYTEAQNKLKLEEANAYADGIVTLEEAARIAEATANLDLAKLDASGKADKARDAAQAFATSKDTLVLQNAQTDAQKKADAAKSAAQVFATAEAEAKRVLAEAYADNVVTVEEARAIKDANDKLALAKADATKKADDAKKAAQDFASAQDVINLTAAKTDAKNKADAAQSAAQTYALQQAEAKRVIAEAYADGIVTAEEAKRIEDVNAKLLLAQADATKKANDAADAAKTYADLQITNMVIGGINLLKLSDVEVTNNSYSMKAYYFTERPSEGDDFVITIWGTLGADRSSFVAYNSGGSIQLGVLKKIKEGVYQLTGKWRIGTANNTYLQIYQFVNGRTSSSTINKIQLELGTQGTGWTLPPQELTALVQSTADAARDAAKVFATSEAQAKRVEAQAYADGIVTAEEQRAIKDANDKLVIAKADSELKANAARDAAKTFATLEANRAITAAQTDATNKSNEAKLAAEKFATAEAEAKQILAQAYADGKITVEEQARIKDSNANLAAAKLDATTKANEATAAAKTFATLEANRVLGLAKTDAQTKADAAKLAAQTFATSEANAKQVLAQAYADGKITAEEARAIKDANDKLEAAKLDATKKANDAADAAKVYSDLQLENLVIGGTNMIDNSNFATQSLAKWSNNGSVSYISIDNRDCAHLNVTNGIYQSKVCKSNVVHSISFWAKAADPDVVTTIRVGFLNQLKCHETFTLTNAWKQYTYTTAVKVTVGQTFYIYSGGKRSYVTDIKVEEGGKVSTWTPSNNDIKAYADSTSLASENAAKAFATAEANAKRVLAEAYADGKVTAEEGKRIEDVNAKLVLAKADAQAKADLAAQAAKDYADTQISNIEIGGRNLMLTSDEYSRTLGRRYGGIAESILGYKDVGYVNAPKSTMSGFNQKYSESAIIGNNYTFSILATYEGAKPKNIQLYAFGSGAYTSLEGVQGMQEGKWTKLTLTRSPITSDYTGTHHMHIYTEGDAPSKVYFACAQVEKGNKASDWTPAAEDVTKSVTDLGESLKDFKDVNITTFSDGLISKSEAKAMDVSKSHLERGFKEINSRYTAIYNNTGLDAAEKKTLKTSYDLWAGTHTSTLGYISTLVTKGTVSLAESAEVTNRFNAYNTNLDALATKLESAQDSIVKALSAKASSDAVNAISIGGRNLMIMANHAFDKGKYLTKTGTFTSSSSWWTTDFIPVTGGKEYITTAVPNPNYNTTVGTCYYDADKVLISCVVGAAQRRLSTAPDTAKFLRMSYVPADFPRLMLEEGNIPSNYAPSPEDVHASALDVGKAFTEFEKDFNESIKDDIITKAEASSLFSLLKVLENESNGLTARKDSLVANSSISADSKTALNTAYTSYDAQYKALSKHMSDSNLAQDLTPARKTAMVTLFNTYKAALSGLTKAIESALDSISATRVEAIKLGGRNLLKLSGSKLTNNLYLMNTYTITEAIPANEEVVVTVWGTLGSDRTNFMVYNLAGSHLANLTLVSPGKYQAQFKWKVGGNNLGLRFYQAGSSGTSSSIIEKIQLEKGNIGTDWTIAPEDITDLTIESDNKIKLVTDANSSLTESYNKTTETTTASFKAIQTGENNMLENSGLVDPTRDPFKKSVLGVNSGYPGHYMMSGTQYVMVDFPSLVTGTTYTFSYELIRNLAPVNVVTSIGTYNNTTATINQVEPIKIVLTFAAKADTTAAKIQISAGNGYVAIVRNIKLEKGSVATSGLSGTLIDTIAELKETKKTATDLKGNVESTWSMEASVNGEISGIYLTKGNKKSDFKVLAEKFYVVNDAGSAVVPFRVEGNKAYAKDLIVDTANITGSLTVGHIPNNLITLDKLVPADRDKINKATEDLANLEIGGRNLIIFNSILAGKYIIETTGAVGSSGSHKATDFIPVVADAAYTLSDLTKNLYQQRIVYYDSAKVRLSGKLYAGAQPKYLTITTPANCAFVRISGDITYTPAENWKFEKGNKATDWSPAPEDVNAAITTVSTSVTDITSDGKVTPNEKRDLLRVKDEIVSTHVELLKSVITVPEATTPTTYTTAYSNVTTRLTNAAASPLVTTDITAIDRKALTDALSVYFTERGKLNDLLVTKTKKYTEDKADAATTAATTAAINDAKTKDTRGVNNTPAEYQRDYPYKNVREFKTKSVIGLAEGAGTYCYLETQVKYGDSSGGRINQTAYTDDSRVFTRNGSGTTWTAWVESETTAGAVAKAGQALIDAKTYADTKTSDAVKDIIGDNKITPNEKRDLLRVKDEIVSTHTELLNSVKTVPGATTPTTYTTSYTNVTTRLTNVAASPTTITNISTADRNNLTTALSTYFTERAKLNDTLVTKSKEYVESQTTTAKDYADNVAKVEVIDAKTKRFISPATYSSEASAVTGYLIIETPIASARMVKLNITGYNYQANKTNIDLSVGFYFNGAFHNFDYADMGTYPIENVRLGIKNSNVVVIIGNANSTWSYPKINITQAIVGYTNPPDSYKDGWVIRHSSTITDITGVRDMDNVRSVSIKSLQDNVYSPGTTKINGGNIETGTVTAAQINAAQLKVAAANVTGTLTAAQISTPNLSSVSSDLGAVTAGSINIGDKFIVDAAGNVNAKNGTFEGDIKLKNGQVDTLQIAGNAVTVPRYVYIAEEKVSGRPPEMTGPYYPYNKLELGSFTYDAQDSAAVTLYVAIDYIKAGRLASRGDWWVKIHLKKNGNIMHTWTRSGNAGSNTYTYEDFWLNLPPYIDVNPKSGGTISLEAECYASLHSDSVNVPGFPVITARGVTFGMVGAKR